MSKKGLTGLSVERPIGVAVLCLAVCILGYIALTRLPVDLLPEVDFPRISIITNYEGVGPEEMETLLTRPIEQAVSTIDGVTEITGESPSAFAGCSLAPRGGAAVLLDLPLQLADLLFRLLVAAIERLPPAEAPGASARSDLHAVLGHPVQLHVAALRDAANLTS